MKKVTRKLTEAEWTEVFEIARKLKGELLRRVLRQRLSAWGFGKMRFSEAEAVDVLPLINRYPQNVFLWYQWRVRMYCLDSTSCTLPRLSSFPEGLVFDYCCTLDEFLEVKIIKNLFRQFFKDYTELIY